MDEKDIRKILDEEIISEIENLKDLVGGTEEKAAAIENVVKLYEMRIKEAKNDWESEDSYKRTNADLEMRKYENSIKEAQLDEQRKDRYFRTGIAACELVLPLMFYGIWMNKGFKFEETGTISSSVFRNLINRFRPTKK